MKEASKLKMARAEAGLSQEELAKLCGVCRTTIHAAETGKAIPNGYTMLRIAKVLNKQMFELFEEEEK